MKRLIHAAVLAAALAFALLLCGALMVPPGLALSLIHI